MYLSKKKEKIPFCTYPSAHKNVYTIIAHTSCSNATQYDGIILLYVLCVWCLLYYIQYTYYYYTIAGGFDSNIATATLVVVVGSTHALSSSSADGMTTIARDENRRYINIITYIIHYAVITCVVSISITFPIRTE